MNGAAREYGDACRRFLNAVRRGQSYLVANVNDDDRLVIKDLHREIRASLWNLETVVGVVND